MLVFHFRNSIAIVGETTPDEPFHPSLVIVVDIVTDYCRIVVPDAVLCARGELLGAGMAVLVSGDIRGGPPNAVHVASQLELPGCLH